MFRRPEQYGQRQGDLFHCIRKGDGLSEKAWRLLQKANDNGGKDNISVILANLAESEVTPC